MERWLLSHQWLSGCVLYNSNFLLGEMVDRKCNLVTVLLDLESGSWSMKIAFGEVTVFGDFFLNIIRVHHKLISNHGQLGLDYSSYSGMVLRGLRSSMLTPHPWLVQNPTPWPSVPWRYGHLYGGSVDTSSTNFPLSDFKAKTTIQ